MPWAWLVSVKCYIATYMIIIYLAWKETPDVMKTNVEVVSQTALFHAGSLASLI